MKNKVLILTDSTVDLPEDIVKKRDITVVPLYIHLGDQELRDGIDINTDQMYEWIEKNKILPSTAAVSPHFFGELIKKYLDQGYDVFYCGIGMKLSGTGRNFLLAAQEFPQDRVFFLDSQNLSSGIAITVLKAADLRDKGYSAKEIHEKLKDLPSRILSQFVIKTLDYMRKGGRATGMQALLGAALRIRPVLRVRDGVLSLYKKAMGKLSRGMDIQIDEFLQEYDNGNIVPDYVFITHTQSSKMYEYTVQRLEEHGVKIKNLIEGQAGCVISSHCGPGTIGILYEVKDINKVINK